jgi:hypothetical protein
MAIRRWGSSPLGGDSTATAATPTSNPVAGTYSGTQSVVLSCVTFGSSIYYTTDGTIPTFPITGTTLQYTTAISVAASQTIKALSTAPSYSQSAVVSAAYTISGVTFSWKTLPVGGGGYVRGLAIAADGTMVGRTDTAGAYLWNGTSWSQLINPSSMPTAFITANFNAGLGGVYEVAIAPSNTQIFYMHFDSNMWMSANQGTTWTQLTSYGTHGGNANNNGQVGQKIGIDPNSPNIVYVGADAGTMQMTTNSGTTWTAVSGVPAGSGNPSISGIVFGPASNQIGGVTQVIYACRQGTGVYVSTNGGTSWTLTSGGPTTVQNALLDNSGNYWCAGNGSDVWKYTASGGTWANLLTGGGNGIQAVAINPFNNSQIVGVDNSGSQMNFSSNGGSTWSGINFNTSLVSTDIPWLGPTSTSGGSGTAFYLTMGNAAFSPITNGKMIGSSGVGMWSMNVPTNPTSVTALTWNDFTVGIENMVASEVIVPPGQNPVLAVKDRSVFFITPGTYPSYYLPVTDKSINAACSIDYASSDATFVCGIEANVNGIVAKSGFSHDNGATWTNFATLPTGTGFGGSIAASTPSNILYTAVGNNAPSFTTNGGASWTQISVAGISNWTGLQPASPDACWRKVCADRVNANTFYLYASGIPSGVGVYISTNSGATWTQQHAGFIETNSGYAAVLCPQIKSVPANAGNLFYCSGPNQFSGSTQTSPLTDDFFFRSTNGGATWTQVANVLEVSSFGFGMAKPGGGGYPAVFINGFVSGVWGLWRSDDNCATWNNIGTWAGPNGLGSIVTMSGDMNTYGTCYVGIGGFGAGENGAGCSFAYYAP